MKNLFYSIAAVVVAAFVGVLIGMSFSSKDVTPVSAVGDTNSTQRIASCVLDMSTTTPTTATTTSSGTNVPCLYNGDSKDRIVTSIDYYLSGLGSMIGATGGVASTTWQLSTSSNVYVGSTNYLLNTTIATSSANGTVSGTLFVASSTPGATATFPFRVWASGSYLDLFTNATTGANSIVGTIKVNYFLNN